MGEMSTLNSTDSEQRRGQDVDGPHLSLEPSDKVALSQADSGLADWRTGGLHSGNQSRDESQFSSMLIIQFTICSTSTSLHRSLVLPGRIAAAITTAVLAVDDQRCTSTTTATAAAVALRRLRRRSRRLPYRTRRLTSLLLLRLLPLCARAPPTLPLSTSPLPSPTTSRSLLPQHPGLLLQLLNPRPLRPQCLLHICTFVLRHAGRRVRRRCWRGEWGRTACWCD